MHFLKLNNLKLDKYKKILAFSLTEILVVISIVGILSAVAVPAYKKYTVKAKIVEGVAIADRAKDFTISYYLKNGVMPTNTDLAKEFSSTSVADIVSINSKQVNLIGYNSTHYNDKTFIAVVLNFYVGESGRNSFYVGIVADTTTGEITTECGLWDISSSYSWVIKDTTYLPVGCKDTNVSAFAGF